MMRDGTEAAAVHQTVTDDRDSHRLAFTPLTNKDKHIFGKWEEKQQKNHRATCKLHRTASTTQQL